MEPLKEPLNPYTALKGKLRWLGAAPTKILQPEPHTPNFYATHR